MKLPLTLQRQYRLRDGTLARIVGMRGMWISAELHAPDGTTRREMFTRRDFESQAERHTTHADRRAWKLKWIQRQIAAA